LARADEVSEMQKIRLWTWQIDSELCLFEAQIE